MPFRKSKIQKSNLGIGNFFLLLTLMWLWERRPILAWWNKDTCENCTSEIELCAHASLRMYTCYPAALSFLTVCGSVCALFPRVRMCVCMCARISVITRWLSGYSAMRKRWSPTRCRRWWSRASSTASAPLTVASGRLFFSRSWSSISDGLSPTPQSCSAACSRSESGEERVRFCLTTRAPSLMRGGLIEDVLSAAVLRPLELRPLN